jgi:predicted Zn-dependent protease
MTSSLVRSSMGRLPVVGALRQPILNLATTLLNQGHAQDQELDADQLGLRLDGAAGYNALAAMRLMQRLRTVPDEMYRLSSYFSSHPPVQVRLQRMERFLAAQ